MGDPYHSQFYGDYAEVTSGGSLIKRFIRWNIRLCQLIRPTSLEHHHAYDRYGAEVARVLLHPDCGRVLDIGAGQRWPFSHKLKALSGIHLTGLDASAAEMAQNHALDERITLDASGSLNVPDSSLDLITGRAVVEHLPDVEAFLLNCHRALRPGGLLILTFINGNSPPALINRMLPEKLAQNLLFSLWPGSDVHQGFKAYYDQTVAGKFRGLLARFGYELEFEYQSYSSSGYARFFVPVFLLSLAYDAFRFFLGVRDLSAFNLFIASKPISGGHRKLWLDTNPW